MINVWSKHYHGVWAERSANTQLPDWLRVAALAYGRHKANGHAEFGPGDVAYVLGKVDEQTGEFQPNENVTRAIRTAVKYGFLAEGSKSRCLVVPAHAIEGGLGNPHARCPMHEDTLTRRRRQRKAVTE
jgi:hypothetical protein